LPKFAIRAHALGDLEARNGAPRDLLAGFSSGFARSPLFAAGFGSLLRALDLKSPALRAGLFALSGL
jgi:hypothetical protein